MAMTAQDYFSKAPEAISAAADAAFFTSLKGRNNTFKKTEAGRFRATDKALVDAIGGASLGEVLDIGISSGITTIDLRDALRAAGHAPRITGTDLWLDACLVPVAPGCAALVDPSGHLLQNDIMGQAVRPWRRRLDYTNGMIAVRALINALFGHRARRALAAGKGRPVQLVSRQMTRHTDVAVQQDDVTVRQPLFVGRFDFVRVANVLNHDYFDEATLARALGNVIAYLSGPGAWLLLIRTLGNGVQHGTLFRAGSDNQLQVVQRFGNGSEVEELALQARGRVSGFSGLLT